MNKLRLLLFEECNRNCSGCCNKDWDLKSLPVCMNYSPYEEIMLTGGEPMLRPGVIYQTIYNIRKSSKAKIYLYTAKTDNKESLYNMLLYLDGLTITLHEQSDVKPFLEFNKLLVDSVIENKNLRLNVFEGVKLEYPKWWVVKDNIKWIKDSPLPKGEVLMRRISI